MNQINLRQLLTKLLVIILTVLPISFIFAENNSDMGEIYFNKINLENARLARVIKERAVKDGVDYAVPAIETITHNFVETVEIANIKNIEFLLDGHADVNSRAGRWPDRTALMTAAALGYTKITKLLLDNHADVNLQDSYGNTAITYALRLDERNFGRFIAEIRYDQLMYNDEDLKVIYDTIPTIFNMLLNKGADIDIKDNQGKTILIRAVEAAAENGDMMVVKLLLDNNANINLQDAKGKTPLMHAICLWNTQVSETLVGLLLEKGADPHLRDGDGKTALMHAAAMGRIKAIQLLLDKHVAVNQQDWQGTTALMYALESHSIHLVSVVNLLLNNGADPNLYDDNCKTAAMRAVDLNLPVQELLFRNNYLDLQGYWLKTASCSFNVLKRKVLDFIHN